MPTVSARTSFHITASGIENQLLLKTRLLKYLSRMSSLYLVAAEHSRITNKSPVHPQGHQCIHVAHRNVQHTHKKSAAPLPSLARMLLPQLLGLRSPVFGGLYWALFNSQRAHDMTATQPHHDRAEKVAFSAKVHFFVTITGLPSVGWAIGKTLTCH